MDVAWVRAYCLSMPHATEMLQWGDHLVFKVAGKVFAVTALEPGETWLSLKVTPEEFAELTERPGIIQAPYFARNQWIALETPNAVTVPELKRLLRRSFELVLEKLPRKVRASLGPC